MAEKQQQEEGQKTFVSFIIGLLIGGMLVWAFSSPDTDDRKASLSIGKKDDDKGLSSENKKNEVKEEESNKDGSKEKMDTTDSETTESKGDMSSDGKNTAFKEAGEIVVSDQTAGTEIKLDKAIYPISEGWVGVREYNKDGKLGYILGVVRFSEKYNMVPSTIILQRPTTVGRKYAVVVFSEDGDGSFNVYKDLQVGEPLDTFEAK